MADTAKMTIRLPGIDLAFATHYAREQGMALTDLVLRYLNRLPREAVQGIPDEVRSAETDQFLALLVPDLEPFGGEAPPD